MLLRYPGVVVLHDLFLHHFVRHHTAGRGDWVGYARELAYTLGVEGRNLGRAVHGSRATSPLFEVSLNERLIDSSLGVIVHSQFAAGGIRQQRNDVPVAVIPALAEIHPGQTRRDELGLPDDAVLFGSFGQITAEKQIGFALEAFNRLRENWSNAHFLLVGEVRPDVELESALTGLALGDRVHHIGYTNDLQSFIDWIHTVDAVINLRQPTVGETSAVALRAMAAARPLIVFDHGWYRELPNSAAIKTPPGDPAALQLAMERLIASPETRLQMGAAGLEYVRRYCLPQIVARSYLEFIRSLLKSPISAYG
jgi:glycosyltransferase involved in cell wall biosynthesis